MRARHILFVTLAACAEPVGTTSYAPLVKNGAAAAPGEWPAVVLALEDGGGNACSGVLVDASHVLFAAHCVFATPIRDAEERARARIRPHGTVPYHQGGTIFREELERIPDHPPFPATVSLDMASPVDARTRTGTARAYRVHPDVTTSVSRKRSCFAEVERTPSKELFDSCMENELRNDFALLELDSPTAIPPMRLMTREQADRYLVAGAVLLVIGYGSDPIDFVKRSGVARVLSPDCSERSDCGPGREFLATEERGVPFLGDSGGPAVLETPEGPLVAGIYSGVPTSTRYHAYGRTDALGTFYQQPWPPAMAAATTLHSDERRNHGGCNATDTTPARGGVLVLLALTLFWQTLPSCRQRRRLL